MRSDEFLVVMRPKSLSGACRCKRILDGTTGAAELSRGSFRQQMGGDLLIDGNQKTCGIDGLLFSASYLGCTVDKNDVSSRHPCPNCTTLQPCACCGPVALLVCHVWLER